MQIINTRGHSFLFATIVATLSKPIYVRFLMLFRKALLATHFSYPAGILKFTVFARIASDWPTTIAICADSTRVKKSLFRARSVPQRGCFQKIYNDIRRIVGEPGRIRTFDPLIKSQLLYHLSYGPTGVSGTLSVVLRQYPNLPHRPLRRFVSIMRKANQMV